MKLTLQAPREKGDWLQKPLILPLEKGKVTGVVGVPKREQGALLADLLVSLSEEEKATTAYVLSDCPYVKMLTGWDNADILESTYPDFCKSKFAQWGQRFGLPLDAPLQLQHYRTSGIDDIDMIGLGGGVSGGRLAMGTQQHLDTV